MPRRRFLRRFAAFTRSLAELFISPSKTVMCSFTLAARSSGWGAQRLMIVSTICRQMSSTKTEITEPIRRPVRSRSGRLFGLIPLQVPTWVGQNGGSVNSGSPHSQKGSSFFALYFLSGCWAHACLIRGSGPSSPAFVAAFPEPLELLQVLIYSD